jgi:hypothetical protein
MRCSVCKDTGKLRGAYMCESELTCRETSITGRNGINGGCLSSMDHGVGVF